MWYMGMYVRIYVCVYVYIYIYINYKHFSTSAHDNLDQEQTCFTNL